MSVKFQVIQGDLFSAPSTTSLAHCVSADMNMSKGIATQFRNQFGQIDNLKRQNIGVGGCAHLCVKNRHVFYLVTKERYFHKPTLKTLEASLISMRDLCIKNNIYQLAMPRIGCGLDKLEWSQVTELIQRVFGQVDIEITIYLKNMVTGPKPCLKRLKRDRDQLFVRPKKKT